MKDIPALSRLLDLDDIASAVVFDAEGRIQASAVPENYNEQMIEQIVFRLKQLIDFIEGTKVHVRECRFLFEGFGIWMRRFSSDLILTVFVYPEAKIEYLRQPINLAIVNLEKVLFRSGSKEGGRISLEVNEIALAAQRAELEMLKVEGEDVNNALTRLGVAARYFLGPVGEELLEHGMREANIKLPITRRADLLKALECSGRWLENVERRKQFYDVVYDIMERTKFEDDTAD